MSAFNTPQRIKMTIGAGLASVLTALAMTFPVGGAAAVGNSAAALRAGTVPNITGAYRAGTGYCWDNSMAGTGNRIVATSPIMDAAQINTTGVGGSQLVGFQVRLERWDEPGRRWVVNRRSPLKVHLQGQWGFYSEVWYDALTGAQVTGLSEFPITTSGFYRVIYELGWFADDWKHVTGYIATLPDGLQDYRPYPPVLVDWCWYRV